MYEARTWVTLENGGEADAAMGGPAETGRGPTSGACCSKRNTERNDAERTEEGLLRRFFCALMRQAIPNLRMKKRTDPRKGWVRLGVGWGQIRLPGVPSGSGRRCSCP